MLCTQFRIREVLCARILDFLPPPSPSPMHLLPQCEVVSGLASAIKKMIRVPQFVIFNVIRV